jgi:HAE1 family hydrophobic/amphiphilic exporter-1
MRVDFFIRRPVFASVCSLLVTLAGALCIPTLPVAQYPDLAAPSVSVNASYLGASAETVEAAVTTPLEQQINGAEGMRYMTSTSASDGSSAIEVVFDLERNIDIAAVDVQNRVSTAMGRLPREVNATGVSVIKNSPAMILIVSLYAEHGEYSDLFISNYADVYLRDALKRVKGVSQIIIFGERKYAMRVWLDPVRLAARGLTAADAVRALREQNLQITAGQVGQPPAPSGQSFQISVRARGRLSEPQEFERMVLKSGEAGAAVLLRDVAKVELGAEDYASQLRFNGRAGIGIAVFQLPGANALEVDRLVRDEVSRLAARFPPGLQYKIAFDPTVAVGESINEVLETLAMAIALVIAVIFLFLQDLRSTLIPAVTIPVSLVGTFIFVKAFGFSINTLTLFGITLATGLVVDDAIVVIENIERHMRERRTPARRAAGSAMTEVAGAVLATSLVLIAVFVPVAFFPGTTGRLYKQFSLTIAFSIAISAFNALTFSPAMAALLLRHRPPGQKSRLFALIDTGLERLHQLYGRWLQAALRRRRLMLVLFLVALGLTGVAYRAVPQGFVPTEDQGFFLVLIQAPEGASLSYTSEVMRKVETALSQDPDIADVFAVAGWSFGGVAPNRAAVFPNLRPQSQRKGKGHAADDVIGRARAALDAIPGALIFAFGPPAIQGASALGGFSFQLLDQSGQSGQNVSGASAPATGQGAQAGSGAGGSKGSASPGGPAAGESAAQRLARVAQELSAEAQKRPELAGVFSQFTANDPLFEVLIDRERAKQLGVALTEIADSLQVFMGAQYINDFDFNARSYRVYAQADRQFRANPSDLGKYYVRGEQRGPGGPVATLLPLDTVIKLRETTAPPLISHYNLFRATELSGQPKPGFSSGQAIAALEQVAARVLPQGMNIEWSGITWEEIRAGRQSLFIFAVGLVFVFLVLAAQYESFVLPLIILLAVPVALLGGLLLQRLRGLPNDVFCQIGLVMLVGLASKNAILIVEFAEQLRAQGRELVMAAIEASQIRLRPILMTSLAFILGLLPLVVARGAGQESRHSLGTPVLGGMIFSTGLNLFFIPVLYVLVQGLRARRAAQRAARAAAAGDAVEVDAGEALEAEAQPEEGAHE